MKRLLITLGAVAILSGAGWAAVTNLSTTALADSPTGSAQTNEQSRVFSIENMTCAACPITVRKAMERVEGVKSVRVNFEAKTATAIFDSNTTTAEDVANASTKVGYPATLLEG